MTTTIALNPEIDLVQSAQPSAHVDINGSSVTYLRYNATGNSSLSNVSFTIIPTGFDVVINRSILEVIPDVTIDFVGTTSGSLLLDNGYDALRSYALERCIGSQNISINGAAGAQPLVRNIIPDILAHFNLDYHNNHPLGCIDPCQEYSESLGSNLNPLADFNNSHIFEKSGMKRGAYTVKSITRTATTARIVLDLYSWVYQSGLLGLDQASSPGLSRVNQIQINQTLDFSAKNIWSHALGGSTSTIGFGCSVSSVGLGYVIVKQISVPRELIPTGDLSFSHFRLQDYITATSGALAPNATAQIYTNTIQLNYIPKYLFLWVRQGDSEKLVTSTDTAGAITNISINFGNMSALLASATREALWTMTKDCGSLDTLTQFLGTSVSALAKTSTSGSFLCLEFGRHIALGELANKIGQEGQYSLQVQLTVTNVNQITTWTNPSIYLAPCWIQELRIDPRGNCQYLATSAEANLASGGAVVQVPYSTTGMGGGKWGEFFRNMAQNVITPLTTAVISATPLAPLAPVLGPGMGNIFSDMIGNAGKHKQTAKGRGGSTASGGAQLSEAQLKQAIRRL